MPKVFAEGGGHEKSVAATKSDWKNDNGNAKVVGKMTTKMQKSLEK